MFCAVYRFEEIECLMRRRHSDNRRTAAHVPHTDLPTNDSNYTLPISLAKCRMLLFISTICPSKLSFRVIIARLISSWLERSCTTFDLS
mmetsp:Transcript_292/g.1018  ORF Transcript_292/g.1018 Transcript_292/m.1018 type:complete len:89 (-) Transcript_292:331-597(-)